MRCKDLFDKYQAAPVYFYIRHSGKSSFLKPAMHDTGTGHN